MEKIFITIKNMGLIIIYILISVGIILFLQNEDIEISTWGVRFVGIGIGLYLSAKNILEIHKQQ